MSGSAATLPTNPKAAPSRVGMTKPERLARASVPNTMTSPPGSARAATATSLAKLRVDVFQVRIAARTAAAGVRVPEPSFRLPGSVPDEGCQDRSHGGLISEDTVVDRRVESAARRWADTQPGLTVQDREDLNPPAIRQGTPQPQAQLSVELGPELDSLLLRHVCLLSARAHGPVHHRLEILSQVARRLLIGLDHRLVAGKAGLGFLPRHRAERHAEGEVEVPAQALDLCHASLPAHRCPRCARSSSTRATCPASASSQVV